MLWAWSLGVEPSCLLNFLRQAGGLLLLGQGALTPILLPSTALPMGTDSGGTADQALTFLSRNEAIRPKFLGCCMNLREEKGHELGPGEASWASGHRARELLPSRGPVGPALPHSGT